MNLRRRTAIMNARKARGNFIEAVRQQAQISRAILRIRDDTLVNRGSAATAAASASLGRAPRRAVNSVSVGIPRNFSPTSKLLCENSPV
jgi:hypothetical protein